MLSMCADVFMCVFVGTARDGKHRHDIIVPSICIYVEICVWMSFVSEWDHSPNDFMIWQTLRLHSFMYFMEENGGFTLRLIVYIYDFLLGRCSAYRLHGCDFIVGNTWIHSKCRIMYMFNGPKINFVNGKIKTSLCQYLVILTA